MMSVDISLPCDVALLIFLRALRVLVLSCLYVNTLSAKPIMIAVSAVQLAMVNPFELANFLFHIWALYGIQQSQSAMGAYAIFDIIARDAIVIVMTYNPMVRARLEAGISQLFVTASLIFDTEYTATAEKIIMLESAEIDVA